MYKIASLSLAASAVALIATIILGQFAADSVILTPIAIVSLLISIFLFRQRRAAAWLGFFLMLFSTSFVLSRVSVGAAPDTFYYIVAALNVFTWVCVFLVLWRHGHKK